MPCIYHQVGIAAAPEKVYAALTTCDGLAGWWTRDTRGRCEPGATIEFFFGDIRMAMQVLELQENALVRWRSEAGDGEWQGTEIVFELHHDGKQTLMDFTHENWAQPTELFRHCSTKWAVFLLSLKALVETGKGSPYPDDMQINHS